LRQNTFHVSVIIPAYNAAAFLKRAVESALQHSEVAEIILIEDGSKDTTWQVCQRLQKQHAIVKLFQHPKAQNKGVGASRNLGINNATKEFVAFLDADDYYTSIRFEKEKEIIKKHPEADGVYGAIGVEYLDLVGAKTWEEKGLDEETLTTVNKPIPSEHLFAFLSSVNNPHDYKGYFSIDGLTLKRSALLALKIRFNPSLRLHQDTVFIWQVSYYLKLVTGEFEKPIAIRGVHSDNRFIHATKMHDSRSKQYKVLRDWSFKENLPEKVKKRFQKKFFEHSMRSKNSGQLFFFYIYLLFTDYPTRSDFRKKQMKLVWKLWKNKV